MARERLIAVTRAMTARGRAMLELGDVSGARLLLTRAAEGGNGEAALLLGATYDPQALEALGARGIAGDPALARHWYERAAQLGAPEAAAIRLQALGAVPRAAER
jgi:TPR repeat protein